MVELPSHPGAQHHLVLDILSDATEDIQRWTACLEATYFSAETGESTGFQDTSSISRDLPSQGQLSAAAKAARLTHDYQAVGDLAVKQALRARLQGFRHQLAGMSDALAQLRHSAAEGAAKQYGKLHSALQTSADSLQGVVRSVGHVAASLAQGSAAKVRRAAVQQAGNRAFTESSKVIDHFTISVLNLMWIVTLCRYRR